MHVLYLNQRYCQWRAIPVGFNILANVPRHCACALRSQINAADVSNWRRVWLQADTVYYSELPLTELPFFTSELLSALQA